VRAAAVRAAGHTGTFTALRNGQRS
jgi:hypothetical protein